MFCRFRNLDLEKCRCFGQGTRSVRVGNRQCSTSRMKRPVPGIEYRHADRNELARIPTVHDEVCQRGQCRDETIGLGKRVTCLPAGLQHQAPAQQRVLGDRQHTADKQRTQRAETLADLARAADIRANCEQA